jgi:DNA transformation protein
MIGLVVADTLYLKTDAESVAQFDRLKLPAFEYRRGDKTMQTSYRQVPAEVFEDREEAAAWGRLAWEAAMRSGHAPKARRSRSAAGPKAVKTTKATKASKTATPNKTTKAAKTVKPAKTTGAPRKAAAR